MPSEQMEYSTNAANAFTNATHRVLDFLQRTSEEWIATCLARELELPRSTVSWALSKLRRQGKVFYRKEGRCNFYSATKQMSDEFERLFKQYGTQALFKIHGLTFKLELKKVGMTNGYPVGGGVDRWGFAWRGYEISFQLSRGN